MENTTPTKEELSKIEETEKSTPLGQKVLEDILAYKNGDVSKMSDLISKNEGLVRSVFYRYYSHMSGSILDEEDFLQVGRMGIMKAVNMFNPDLGYQFSTYAHWWVKHEMHSLTRIGEPIRMPEHVAACADRIRVYINQQLSNEQPEPTKQDILDHFCKKDKSLRNAYSHAYDHIHNEYVHVDDSASEDGDTPIHEILDMEKKDFTLLVENQNIVQQLIDSLTEREKKVVFYRFEKQCSLQEVADIMNISRQRVTQLEARSIKKMRIRALRLNLYQEMNARAGHVLWQRG